MIALTSIKYNVERDIYLISLALQPLSAGNSAEFSQADNSKTIHCRAMKPTSLDSLGSCESIYIHFKTINLEKHELNHFNDNRNTVLDLFRSLPSEHNIARETKIQSF